MNLRKKLTLQFATLVALLMIISLAAIYYSSAAYRKQDFYDRLERKAQTMVHFLNDLDKISPEILSKIEQVNPTDLPYEKIRIYDSKDSLLFSTDKVNLFKLDPALMKQVRSEGKIYFKKNHFEALGFNFRGKSDQYVVLAGAIDVRGFKKLENLNNMIFLVFAVSMIFVLLAGWFFAGRALKPISKVITQVSHINATDLSVRLDEGKNNDEIGQLAKTFNSMLDRIESAFIIQKNFIANASHELRTPLTNITGQLEVTLLKARKEEEYRQTIESVLDDMRNLNQISNRLLLLAQTSTENFSVDFKPLRLDETVWQARSELIRLKPEYAVQVEISSSIDHDQQLIISGNDFLLKTAIMNLLDNGCKYSADHTVRVTVKNEQGYLVIRFDDRGIGISKEDLKYIFQPFFRGKNTMEIKGHGIGLSLVKRIVDFHEGALEVKSEINKRSSFILKFKIRS